MSDTDGLQQLLTEEIADDASGLLSWARRPEASVGVSPLDAQYDEILGRLYAKVRLVVQLRQVLAGDQRRRRSATEAVSAEYLLDALRRTT